MTYTQKIAHLGQRIETVEVARKHATHIPGEQVIDNELEALRWLLRHVLKGGK